MDNKLEQLEAWGCDVHGAMDRMLNDEEFYLCCLNSIARDPNFAALKQSLEKKEAGIAFDYAHALKGVLANVGLTPMYHKAVEIVEPLRQSDCDDLYDALLEKTDELIQMRDTLSDILK